MYPIIISIFAVASSLATAPDAIFAQESSVADAALDPVLKAPTKLHSCGGRLSRVAGIFGTGAPSAGTPMLLTSITVTPLSTGRASAPRTVQVSENSHMVRLRALDVLLGKTRGESLVATLDSNIEGPIQLRWDGQPFTDLTAFELPTEEYLRFARPIAGHEPQAETVPLTQIDSIALLGTYAAPILVAACASEGSPNHVLVEVDLTENTTRVVGRGSRIVHAVDEETNEDWLMTWDAKAAPSAVTRRVARRASDGTWTEWALPSSRGGFDRLGRLAVADGKVTLLSGEFGDTRDSFMLGAWCYEPDYSRVHEPRSSRVP